MIMSTWSVPESDDLTDRDGDIKGGVKTIHQSSSIVDVANCNSIPSLPPDILIKILNKFSMKTLIKLRCVCRSWRQLISDPIFSKTHLEASIQDNDFAQQRFICLTCCKQTDSPVLKPYPFSPVFLVSPNNKDESHVEVDPFMHLLPHPQRSIVMVGSVDGLVCLSIDEKSLFLWNPLTRQVKGFPICHIGNCQSPNFLTFMRYGFGYDEASSQYKIMVIYSTIDKHQGPSQVQVQIYGLKCNSWRKIENFPEKHIPLKQGKFVNGSLHWVNSGWKSIVSFDLSKDAYSEITRPYHAIGLSESNIGVFNGCLSLLYNSIMMHADLWVMKDYGKVESWSKLFSISYLSYPISVVPVFIFRKDKVFMMNGNHLVYENDKVLMVNHENHLVPYHQNTISYLNIDKAGFQVDVYIASLVWPYPQ